MKGARGLAPSTFPRIRFLRMSSETLLADPHAIRVDYIRPTREVINLIVHTTAKSTLCPRCRRSSSRVHSRYTRTVADLPWHGVAVRLRLHTRRFRCQNSLCPQCVFCERLPRVVAHYARKTVRLHAALELIGLAIGGEDGARLARGLGLIVSPDTLLRRLRRSLLVETSTPRVVGVDDFAFKRGQRYGTLLVDLERRRPVDLLPDREAETLSAWLREHPGIEIVTRDRSKTYASGITDGAPTAVQVADRWHLLKNLREALEQLLKRILPAKGKRIRVAVRPPEKDDLTAGKYVEQCRIRLLPHLFRCSSGSTSKRVPPVRPPPPREVARMMLRPEQENEEKRGSRAAMPALPGSEGSAGAGTRLHRDGAAAGADGLPAWLRAAAVSKLREFVGFAKGIAEDYEAVRNALTYEWSNGQLEGQVNRLKLIKRMMYGRAKFDLLKARVLHPMP